MKVVVGDNVAGSVGEGVLGMHFIKLSHPAFLLASVTMHQGPSGSPSHGTGSHPSWGSSHAGAVKGVGKDHTVLHLQTGFVCNLLDMWVSS